MISVITFGSAEVEVLRLFALLVVGIAVAGLLAFRALTRRWNMEAVARKFGGGAPFAWTSTTDLELSIDGVPAQLSHYRGSKERRAFTRLRLRMPVGGRLRVVPDGVWESLKKAFWSEDLRIGEPAFDAAYLVQGHPTEWVRRVLDGPSCARVQRLDALGGGLTLEAGPGGVLFRLPRSVVGSLPALEQFVGTSVDLFRALRHPPKAGVTFLSAEEVVAKGSCPVCEHPLEVDVRRCRACATPHHGECWAYFGGCATYACSARGGKL